MPKSPGLRASGLEVRTSRCRIACSMVRSMAAGGKVFN